MAQLAAAAPPRGTTTGRRPAGTDSCPPRPARRTAPSRSRGSSAGTAAWRGTRSRPGRACRGRGRAASAQAPSASRSSPGSQRVLPSWPSQKAHERALERTPALSAGTGGRQGTGEQLVEAAHPAGDVRHERPSLVGDRDLAQQAAVVAAAGVHVAGVDDGDAQAVQRDAGALGDPPLDGDVLQVVLLEPRGRLDLDHAAAAAAPLEHVGADQHAAVPERGLVERHVAGLRQRVLGLAQRLAQGRAVADEHAAGVQLAGHLADAVARGEAALGVGAVDLEVRAVHGQPEPFAALQAGGDA